MTPEQRKAIKLVLDYAWSHSNPEFSDIRAAITTVRATFGPDMYPEPPVFLVRYTAAITGETTMMADSIEAARRDAEAVCSIEVEVGLTKYSKSDFCIIVTAVEELKAGTTIVSPIPRWAKTLKGPTF